MTIRRINAGMWKSMTSTEIFNYVRGLELENEALKTAVAEYQADEESRKNLFEHLFGCAASREQPAELITPEIEEKISQVLKNGMYIIC